MSRFTMECTVCGAETKTDEVSDLVEFDKVHGIRCGKPDAEDER